MRLLLVVALWLIPPCTVFYSLPSKDGTRVYTELAFPENAPVCFVVRR